MFYISLYLSKLTNLISKLLKIGSGYTWPGHIALNIYPGLLNSKKIHFKKGVILISGTNGKTTTSKLITHLLENSSLEVTHNKTGANLLNGIVSSILLDMNLFGKLKSDVGVFEVDENILPLILKYLSPSVLVLLNLSRDQLDRYGEVDIILDKWLDAVKNLDSSTEIVLDSTQKNFKKLPEIFKGEITYFDDDLAFMNDTNLVGSFNAKNINAAIFTCMLLGLGEDELKISLNDFEYAYGRGELVEYKDNLFKILLAKNPASFNNNLDAVISGIESDALLFILNDNIPDGRDISWIYDINPLLLKETCEGKEIFVAGKRNLEMAVRLGYAGVEVKEVNIIDSLSGVLDKVLVDSDVSEITIFPNYSAMLEIRKLLVGKNIL